MYIGGLGKLEMTEEMINRKFLYVTDTRIRGSLHTKILSLTLSINKKEVWSFNREREREGSLETDI